MSWEGCDFNRISILRNKPYYIIEIQYNVEDNPGLRNPGLRIWKLFCPIIHKTLGFVHETLGYQTQNPGFRNKTQGFARKT